MSEEYENDFSDPDFLAVVAHDLLDEIHSTNFPQDYSSSKDARAKVLRRQQVAVLDSIANLCVYQERGQVVAIAAALHPGNTAIFVAENGGAIGNTVVDHLDEMFTKLKTIREALPQGEPVHSFVAIPQSPFEAALVDLDGVILRFSWAKFRRRLVKDRRLANFTLVVRDIVRTPAVERDNLPTEQRQLLAELQESSYLDHKELVHVAVDLGNLSRILNLGPNDRTVLGLRVLLVKISLFYEGVCKRKEIFAAWNAYLESRTPQTVKKQPDTLRWLQKVVSIREDAQRVARLATSDTLAGILRGVEIIAVPTQLDPKTIIKMNEKTIQGVLNAAQYDLKKEGGKTTAEYLEKLAATAGASRPDEEKLECASDQPRPVHCECALLAALHGLPLIPYIGTSKPSCGFCCMYFEAYRAVTKSTLGT
ncbi:hypothetical protein B0H16DRAFT_1798136, partial [Mycena metata]